MNQYYLMAQLPSLDGVGESSPIPVTEERFYELCGRFLGKKAMHALNGLTLVPARNAGRSGYALIDSWNEGEKLLRLALGKVRADKIKKTFETENESLPVQLMQAAKTAADSDNPLEAEQLLNRYRLEFLESIRPSDAFCEDSVFYYGLKLKLLSRMCLFDEGKGREEYGNIYSSIIRGDNQEVE